MPLSKSYNDFQVSIFNDTDYNPNSVDNSRNYNHVYTDENHSDYLYLTKHGIELYRNEEILNSVLVISSGGATGIHETSFLMENDLLSICCANSIFCLTIPDLNLAWHTKADTTPTGKNTFSIIDDIIYATNWDNVTFQLNAGTRQLSE